MKIRIYLRELEREQAFGKTILLVEKHKNYNLN